MRARKSARFLLAALVGLLAQPVYSQPIPDWTIEQLEVEIDSGNLGKIRAAAIEQGGEIVYRKRFDDAAMGDPVDIKSAGKSITALAVAAAVADGDLPSLQLQVWPYLDASRGSPWDSIAVSDLLNMSSALDCNDWERRSPGQEEKMYSRRDWREFALGLPARHFERDDRGHGPFSYCTAGVFLLGQIVEKAVGERFDRYVQRRLFDPLGIEGAVWRRSRRGEVQSGGQLSISDEALLRLGRMVMDGGVWKGQRILPQESLQTILTPVHQLGSNVGYGNLWWFSALRSQRGYEGAAMMKGNGGNIVALVPTLDAVLVVQSENYNKDFAERNGFIVLTTMLRDLPVEPLQASESVED